MAVYINSLDTGNGPFLDELEREALACEVPIIRQDMQSFLKVLLALHKPARILEVGTAVGFSALLMAANTSCDCRIATIEKYEKRLPQARKNFAASGMGFKGMVLKSRDVGADFFVPGRMAMTCCADDTTFIGYVCKSKNAAKLAMGSWVEVTATVDYRYVPVYHETGPVFQAKTIRSAQPPESELVYFN